MAQLGRPNWCLWIFYPLITWGIVILLFTSNCDNYVDSSDLMVPFQIRMWKKWIIEMNCKLYRYYGNIRYKQVIQSPRQLNKNLPFPLFLNQKEESTRAFIIPSTVIINNVSSSCPKSILIHLPCENKCKNKSPAGFSSSLSYLL